MLVRTVDPWSIVLATSEFRRDLLVDSVDTHLFFIRLQRLALHANSIFVAHFTKTTCGPGHASLIHGLRIPRISFALRT